MKHNAALPVTFITAFVSLAAAACAARYAWLAAALVTAGLPPALPSPASLLPALPRIAAASAAAAAFAVQGAAAARRGSWAAQLFAAFLTCAVWFCLIPAFARLIPPSAPPLSGAPAAPPPLTAGVFRPYRGGVFFAVRAGSGGETLEGVALPPAGTGGGEAPLEEAPEAAFRAPPYADILAASALEPPAALAFLAREAAAFAAEGERALRGGFLAWLCFASLALPLGAASAFARSGPSRLGALAVMLTAECAVLAGNRLYYYCAPGEALGAAFSAVSAASGIPGGALPLALGNACLAVIIALGGGLAAALAARKAPPGGNA